MKTNFLSFSIIFAVGLLLYFSSGCKKEEKKEPGPISVDNSISPTTVSSGNSVLWDIKVSNMGDEVEIEKVHVREEFISGWAQGQGTVEMDLPISNITIDDHATTTVFSVTKPIYNTGNTDVEVKNTVTVTSNGGTDTDVVIYKILSAYKKGNKPKTRTIILNVK